MKAICLRAEYLDRPIGLDITKPRFFWNCEGGVKQTAYQIVVKRRRRNTLGHRQGIFGTNDTHTLCRKADAKPGQS